MEFDMTGQSLEQNPNWKERVENLCKAENFDVRIAYSSHSGVSSHLSTREIERMQPKLKLVVQFAAAMAAGMLKGTIKYPTDNWGAGWEKNMLGEQADTINYILLTLDSMHRREQAHQDSKVPPQGMKS